MRLSILLLSLLAVLCAEAVRAEALAPSGAVGHCLSADVNVLRPLDNGQVLYRIVFFNRCETSRSFFWRAEHSAAQVPATVACRSQRGFGLELRHAIRYRKEFQWNLPQGARIRFQDCSDQEIPTDDFNCAPLATSTTRR